jgi:hypothetical protein
MLTPGLLIKLILLFMRALGFDLDQDGNVTVELYNNTLPVSLVRDTRSQWLPTQLLAVLSLPRI